MHAMRAYVFVRWEVGLLFPLFKRMVRHFDWERLAISQ